MRKARMLKRAPYLDYNVLINMGPTGRETQDASNTNVATIGVEHVAKHRAGGAGRCRAAIRVPTCWWHPMKGQNVGRYSEIL